MNSITITKTKKSRKSPLEEALCEFDALVDGGVKSTFFKKKPEIVEDEGAGKLAALLETVQEEPKEDEEEELDEDLKQKLLALLSS